LSTKHLSPETLNERRLQAVRLRLDGHTVAEASQRSGLSAPTVSAAWKAFLDGGWQAVPVKPRGRRRGSGDVLDEALSDELRKLLATVPPGPLPAWHSRALAEALVDVLEEEAQERASISPRAIEHWWESQGLKVASLDLQGLERKRSNAGRWFRQQVRPAWNAANKAGGRHWQGGVRVVAAVGDAPRCYQLYLHGKRDALHMLCLAAPPIADDYIALFERLLAQAQAPVALVFHGAYFQASPEITQWLERHPEMHLIAVPTPAGVGA
jgi:transposase